MPYPKRNLPKAMAAQLVTGFLATFFFYTALYYGITSLPDVINTNITAFPLGTIYLQATGSRAGTVCLLSVVCLAMWLTVAFLYVTTGRML